jgi:dihydropteroate synthase
MAVLNVTPDSFSDGGRYLSPEQALEQARRLKEEGKWKIKKKIASPHTQKEPKYNKILNT